MQKLVGSDIFDGYHPFLKELASVRLNTQGNKGEKKELNKGEFKEGLYEASGFQPMSNYSRAALNTCWKADCEWASATTKFRYEACREFIISKL